MNLRQIKTSLLEVILMFRFKSDVDQEDMIHISCIYSIINQKLCFVFFGHYTENMQKLKPNSEFTTKCTFSMIRKS